MGLFGAIFGTRKPPVVDEQDEKVRKWFIEVQERIGVLLKSCDDLDYSPNGLEGFEKLIDELQAKERDLKGIYATVSEPHLKKEVDYELRQLRKEIKTKKRLLYTRKKAA